MATPENLGPAPPDAQELGQEIANSFFDLYTDEDWKEFLNRLHPDQAAGVISHRPVEDRQSLLMLMNPDHRATVEGFLVSLRCVVPRV